MQKLISKILILLLNTCPLNYPLRMSQLDFISNAQTDYRKVISQRITIDRGVLVEKPLNRKRLTLVPIYADPLLLVCL